MLSEVFCALFRRVSPCVRFVAKRRESTRRNLSRRVGRFSRFVTAKILSNIRSKSIDTNVRVCYTEHTFDKEAFFFDGHDSTDFASTLRYNICYGGTLWNIKLTKSVIDELLANVCENLVPSDELVELFRQLTDAMKEHKGKWLYGYLPKPTKELVDKIIHEIAKDEGIAALYAKWNEINREKLSLYHEKETPDIPLEDNKEFRSIKNDLLRAFKILSQLPQENPVNAAQVTAHTSGLLTKLAKLIAQSCRRKRAKLRSQVDSKLLSEIEEKKRAHGLKTDRSVQSNDDSEEEYYGISM